MLVRALIVLFSVLNLGAAVWWIAHDPPSPPATVQVPPGVAHLQLVDEAGVPAPQATAVTATAAATAAPPPVADGSSTPQAQQCFSFGPFTSNDAGTVAAGKLKPLVQALATRGQAATSPTRGWRVYLPPQPSLQQAEAVAQRIGAAGFSDFFIVREGAEANSIALGRYRAEEAANKHAQALNAAGFAARAEALDGAESAAVWLDVVADAAFDPRRAQATIAAEQFRKVDCAARR
jgi:hypothetical protein